MKKKLLLIITFLITVIGHSQTFTDNYITYSILATMTDEVEITDYDFTGGTIVTIPSTVTYNTVVYTVSSIANNAFEGNATANEQLTSVTIPNGIISIGINAFGYNLLTDITIPDSVTSLGTIAFIENQLTNVTLSNSLTSIEAGVFQNNDLASIVIPNGITTIGANAFLNNQILSLTIPSSVTTIGARAFRGNLISDITTLGNTPALITTDILNDSFSLTRNTIDLAIPAGTSSTYTINGWTGFNSVTEILNVGDQYTSNFFTYKITSTVNNTAEIVDYDVTGGTSVITPTSVTNGLITYTVNAVGNVAFSDKNLSNLTITDGIISIGINSFRNNQLTNISIPSSLTSIGSEAFTNNQLTNIIIPNTVTSLGGNAFSFNQLTSVTLPSTMTIIPLGAFQQNQITSVTIPNNVTSIEPGAFENNLLTSITIPSNVTNISARAFKDNPLTTVISQNTTAPTIITQNTIFDTFIADRSGIDLIIPSGSIGSYVTDSGALWTGFNTVNGSTLSVSNFELENPIKLLTNNNSIQIITETNIRLKKYIIYNITGSEIASGKEKEFSTATLPKGIYLVKLNFNEGVITKKILIQ